MGASDRSFILTSTWEYGHEGQLRRTLPGDRHRDLRTESGRLPTKCAERLGHWAVHRDDHMHEQVPAVRRWRHILNEQIVQAVVCVPIGEREIQRTLYLSAELPRLAFGLPT